MLIVFALNFVSYWFTGMWNGGGGVGYFKFKSEGNLESKEEANGPRSRKTQNKTDFQTQYVI